jgi:hypothetical protein
METKQPAGFYACWTGLTAELWGETMVLLYESVG